MSNDLKHKVTGEVLMRAAQSSLSPDQYERFEAIGEHQPDIYDHLADVIERKRQENEAQDEAIVQLNLRKCEEAMRLLYETYVINSTEAAHRGYAITAIDNWVIAIQERNDLPLDLASSKIASVPWSKRMRESGEPLLQSVVAFDPTKGE